MKRIFKGLIIIYLFISFLSCQTQMDSSEDTGNDNGDNTNTVLKTIKLYDNNDTFIGYNINTDSYGITVVTSEDFIVELYWDGKIRENSICYTEDNGGGTPITHGEQFQLSGKMILKADGKYYKAKNIDPDGTIVVSSPNKLYSSRWDDDNQVYDNTDGIIYQEWFELEEISRETVGLPAVITPPIKLVISNN